MQIWNVQMKVCPKNECKVLRNLIFLVHQSLDTTKVRSIDGIVAFPEFLFPKTLERFVRSVYKTFTSVCFYYGGQSRQQLLIVPEDQSKVLTMKYITKMLIERHRNVQTIWPTCFHTFIDSYITVIIKKFRWKSASWGNQKLSAIFVWFQMLFRDIRFVPEWWDQWRFSDQTFCSLANVTERSRQRNTGLV